MDSTAINLMPPGSLTSDDSLRHPLFKVTLVRGSRHLRSFSGEVGIVLIGYPIRTSKQGLDTILPNVQCDSGFPEVTANDAKHIHRT
jgi:ethanolamine utilization microcompartment shell protein EutL